MGPFHSLLENTKKNQNLRVQTKESKEYNKSQAKKEIKTQQQAKKKTKEAKEEKTKNEPEMKICEHTKPIANTN